MKGRHRETGKILTYLWNWGVIEARRMKKERIISKRSMAKSKGKHISVYMRKPTKQWNMKRSVWLLWKRHTGASEDNEEIKRKEENQTKLHCCLYMPCSTKAMSYGSDME